MHNITKIIIASILVALIIGCKKNENLTTIISTPDQTNGRITIVNDEVKLNGRVKLFNDTIQVESGNLAKITLPNAVKLVLEAEIDPPTINGQTLQATSVSLDGKFAYISYNVRGEIYSGAVDIVQIKGEKNATIRSQALFNDTKVSAVYFDQTTSNVYLAEASGNAALAAPALVEKIETNGNKLSLSNTTKTVLSSFVTTSVFAKNSTLYATTGNTGGLYTLTTDNLKQLSYTPISDARWVDVDANYIAVVQGGGKLSVFNVTNKILINTYNFKGTSIAESKSTVQIIGGKALIAAGDGGVVLMNLVTGKIVGSIPRTIIKGMDSSVTVTNAAAASGEYLYISNGEAGVYQAKSGQDISSITDDTNISLTIQGQLKFKSLQSVNHVAFDGETLVIASGLGGVKIVKVK